MGSVFKAAKKVAKRITRPVSKITKGIARGIAKVGKSVMRGVAKINKKLGPLGMIAMSVAMPYALGGLSNMIGRAAMSGIHGPTGLMGSQNLFLRSIGQVGNAIRTGYQATTGAISNTMSTITKSISNGFQKFAGNFKGQNNIFSRISKGAKNLFNQSKTTINNWKSKMKFGKTKVDGSVDVFGMRGNVHGEGQIWSTVSNEQAAGMLKSGTIDGTMLRGQSIGNTLSGVDRIVADNINAAWESKNLVNYSDNAKLAYKNYKDLYKINNDGFYQAEHIGNAMNKNLTMSNNADGLIDFNFANSKDFTYSPQHNKYIFNSQGETFKVNGQSTLKKKTKDWITKSVKSKAYDTIKKSLLNQDLNIEAPPINYAMMGAMHTGSTQGQDAKWSGTDLKGASQGSLLHGSFSAQQIDQINNYYRHMNI
tara:strand:+ start:2309 stop:3577 length:1269 start_codon:yes stop_codon:yes gene_type:complete